MATSARSRADRRRDREGDGPDGRPKAAARNVTGARGTHDVAQLPVHTHHTVQPKLSLSTPGDPCERQADAVAARVAGGGPVQHAARPPGPAGVLRKPAAAGTSTGRGTVPAGVQRVIEGGGHGPGLPLAPSLRAHIEPHIGVDLGAVRVHTGPQAAAAAAALQARAFTSGSSIYLGDRESPYDVRLMAHEATHVAQQNSSAVARSTVMRQTDAGAGGGVPLPEFLTVPVRALPGYTTLTLITGKDLLTNAPVKLDRDQLVTQLLSFGPFGPVAGEVMKAAGVIGDVFSLLIEGLAQHNLTAARLSHEIAQAWEEIHLTEGPEANLAVVRRHLGAVLTDIRAFIGAVAARVMELIRTAAAAIVEPLLETPQFKPIWELAKKVLHYDPLRDRPVEAQTVEILEDFLRLIGKESALAQMKERGTLQKTADWLDEQAATFTGILGELRALFRDAWAAIQPQNLPDLLTNLKALAGRAFALVGRIGDFAGTVIGKVLSLVKDALLGWLSQYAHKIPGFHLLTVILGKNPFTGEAVERNAQNLIKGFITLLPDGEATYEQLASSGVIAEAAARIESEMARLGVSVDLITSTFRGVWDTLQLQDLLDPIGAFIRVTAKFGEPLGRIVEFVGVVVEVVVGLVLKLMNFPTDLLARIVANVSRAIKDIKRDPVAFLLHMLEALKTGFMRFFDHIGTYLVQGLVKWLFRGLGQLGITIPTEITFKSILGLIFEVLGVGVETLWQKLGKHIGPERVAAIRGAVNVLTGAWSFIADVQTRGAPAIADFLAGQLSGLWDKVLGMARDWITKEIIEGVVAKLLSMLDPTGVMAVVNSFIAFFRAVQSAIEYLRDILEIVDQYVTTFAEVAAGRIDPGAAMIEKGLANAVPIAIGFLASQVGIGNVPEAIVGIIRQVRQLIDQAVEWLFTQAMRIGAPVLNALGAGGAPAPAGAGGQKPEALHEHFDLAGEDHEVYPDSQGRLMVASAKAQPVGNLDQLRALDDQYRALPATATATERRRIIREMIRLIRNPPGLLVSALGDPPNLGGVARHGSQPQRFRPRSGNPAYAELWELESEHVIPRSYVDSVILSHFSSAGDREKNWVTKEEYAHMHTILIYKQAANDKTNRARTKNVKTTKEVGLGSDQRLLKNFAIRTESGTLPGRGTPADNARRAFKMLAEGAVRRTVDAVSIDYKNHGVLRGSKEALPTEKGIRNAAALQLKDINEFLAKRKLAQIPT
ncbi:eCIS core domain-containing protein [Streptomyces sp. 5.8]|uniref:eCIS core domain-containing protein n=1 Tax=Streptomyces sp. 5.8 TaxID=3406571 RepID=UPI003BB5FA4D